MLWYFNLDFKIKEHILASGCLMAIHGLGEIVQWVVCPYMPIISTHRRWEKKDQKFKVLLYLHSKLQASLGYMSLSQTNNNIAVPIHFLASYLYPLFSSLLGSFSFLAWCHHLFNNECYPIEYRRKGGHGH